MAGCKQLRPYLQRAKEKRNYCVQSTAHGRLLLMRCQRSLVTVGVTHGTAVAVVLLGLLLLR